MKTTAYYTSPTVELEIFDMEEGIAASQPVNGWSDNLDIEEF